MKNRMGSFLNDWMSSGPSKALKLSFILSRFPQRYFPELFVEIGERVKPAFITDMGHGFVCFSKHFTGMLDTNFRYKPRKGFVVLHREITAE
jgi:hypothetical protein